MSSTPNRWKIPTVSATDGTIDEKNSGSYVRGKKEGAEAGGEGRAFPSQVVRRGPDAAAAEYRIGAGHRAAQMLHEHLRPVGQHPAPAQGKAPLDEHVAKPGQVFIATATAEQFVADERRAPAVEYA